VAGKEASYLVKRWMGGEVGRKLPKLAVVEVQVTALFQAFPFPAILPAPLPRLRRFPRSLPSLSPQCGGSGAFLAAHLVPSPISSLLR
jgi:hypothetical protein